MHWQTVEHPPGLHLTPGRRCRLSLLYRRGALAASRLMIIVLDGQQCEALVHESFRVPGRHPQEHVPTEMILGADTARSDLEITPSNPDIMMCP